MHELRVAGVVVPAILREEDPLNDERLIAAVPIVEDVLLVAEVDVRVAVVGGGRHGVHECGIGRAGHGGVRRHAHQSRRGRVVDDHNLVEAVSHIATIVDGGVGQDMVVIASSRHHTVVDEDRVEQAILLDVDDAGLDQDLQRRFIAAGPLVAFHFNDLLTHHLRRDVVGGVDVADGLGRVAARVLGGPPLLVGAAVPAVCPHFHGALEDEGREARLGTIVRGRHAGRHLEGKAAVLHHIGGDAVNHRGGVVMAHDVELVLPHAAVLDVGTEVGLAAGRTGVEVGAAFEVDDDVAHGASELCATDGALPTEPASCSISAVVVVGPLAHLEAEVLAAWSVRDPNEAPGQTALAQQVALVGFHGVDVPGVRGGRAAHGVLEAAAPVRSIHPVLVDDEHLEPLIGIILGGHLPFENGHVILVLSQGQPDFRLDEVVARHHPGQRNAVHAECTVWSNALGSGRLAGGHTVCTVGENLCGEVLRHGAGVHHGQRGARIGIQFIQTRNGVVDRFIGSHITNGVAVNPAISIGMEGVDREHHGGHQGKGGQRCEGQTERVHRDVVWSCVISKQPFRLSLQFVYRAL